MSNINQHCHDPKLNNIVFEMHNNNTFLQDHPSTDAMRARHTTNKLVKLMALVGRESLKGIARTKGIVCKKVLCVKRYHEQIYRLPYFGIKHKQHNQP